eukprot:Skav221335  [mRNA]  locus=scaffold1234:122961:129223:+ [translate_table: standard]
MRCNLPSSAICCHAINVVDHATAHKNSLTTVPLLCDGFRPMDDSLQVLASYWGPEQMQMLANHRISLEDVDRAYRWMQQELRPLRMPRFGPAWRREACAVDLLQRCDLPSSKTAAQVVMEGGPGGALAPAGKHYNPNGARILITSCITDAEAPAPTDCPKAVDKDH